MNASRHVLVCFPITFTFAIHLVADVESDATCCKSPRLKWQCESCTSNSNERATGIWPHIRLTVARRYNKVGIKEALGTKADPAMNLNDQKTFAGIYHDQVYCVDLSSTSQPGVLAILDKAAMLFGPQ